MTKRSLKDEKQKHEKAKTEQEYCHKKKVEVDYKQGEKVKEKQKFMSLPRLKRVRCSDDENCLEDHVERDSDKKRKKRRKDTDVKTSQPSDSVEDKYQREGKVKKKREKCREREQELAGTANVDSTFEESNFNEKTSLGRGEEKKEVGESRRDENEHLKQKDGKKAKEPKVDVGEKRKKRKRDNMNVYEVQQKINQKGDLQNISDANNVDDEVDNKKKKKKRTREVEPDHTLDTESNEKIDDKTLDTSEDVDTEETDTVKKEKKKKSKRQPGQESKTTIHPGIDYLHTWHNSRGNWNFKKVRQVWLLQNMFDQEQISDENFQILLKYLEGLKGAAKDKTIEMAEQSLESGTGASEQDAVVESRVRQVLQLLTD
ncbi:hypothetical protein ACROYT_G038438 [Oculina patagonica]